MEETSYTYKDQQGREIFLVEDDVTFKIIAGVILSIILPIIGGIILLYRGYFNLYKKDYSKFYRKEMQMQYKPDKRYNSGKRPLGEIEVKITSKGTLVPKQQISNKTKGRAYIILGILSVVLYFITFIFLSK